MAVLRFLVAAAFLPAAARLVDFRLAGLRAVVRFRVAAAFLAPVFLRAVVRFLVAAAFLPAAFLVGDFLLAGFRAAVFLAVRFRAAVLRAAIPFPLSSVGIEGSWVTTPSV